MTIKKVALAAVVCMLCLQTAYGADLVWTGSTDSTWATPGNWNPAQGPTATDNVAFDDTASLYGVTVAGAPTVGNITFNSTTNAFTLTGTLTSVGNITVAPSALNQSIIGGNLTLGSSIIDVGEGATLTTMRIKANTAGTVTKNSAGTWIITASGGDNGNGANRVGYLDINAGTVKQNVAGDLSIYRGVDVADGATLDLSAGTLRLTSAGSAWLDCDIQGTVSVKELNIWTPSTIIMSGNGRFNGNGGGATVAVIEGFLKADNTVTNINDRYTSVKDYTVTLPFTLIGHDDALSTQIFKTGAGANAILTVAPRNNLFTIQHGSTASAIIGIPGGWKANNGGIVTLVAKDSTGTALEDLGTDADFIAGANKSYFGWSANSNEFVGNAGQKVSPYFITRTSAGSSFVTQLNATTTILQRYDGTGAKNFAAAPTSLDNVEDGGTINLTSGYSINSLKLTNSGTTTGVLDLGGSANTLAIGGAKGGGIIVTGSGGALIQNGNIGNSTSNPLFITTDTNLELASSTWLSCKSLTKAGTAKLTLSDINFSMAAPATIYWVDGGLDLTSAYDWTIAGQSYGGPGTETYGQTGQFVKDGAGIVTMKNRNWGNGGVLVKAGTVIVTANGDNPGTSSPLGYGLTEVQSGASMKITNAQLMGTLQVNDGGYLLITGGGSDAGGALDIRNSNTTAIQSAGTFAGPITLSNGAMLTSTNGSTFMTGDITLNNFAYANLGGSGAAGQTITLNDNSIVNLPKNGKVWGNFKLYDNSRLILNGNEKPGAVTLYDNSILDMSYGAGIGTDVTFQGDVAFTMQSSGTVRGGVKGNITVQDNATASLGTTLNQPGFITLKNSSTTIMYTDPGYRNTNTVAFTIQDYASVRSTGTNAIGNNGGMWQSYSPASTIVAKDHADVIMGIETYLGSITTEGNANAFFDCTNGMSGIAWAGLATAATVTSKGASHLTYSGDPILSGIDAQDTSVMRIGGHMYGPILVGTSATLILSHGDINSDVSSLLDKTNVSLGGGETHMIPGTAGNNALDLKQSIDMTGGKTFRINEWDNPTYVAPYVRVWDLSGTGDITVAGGTNSGLQFTTTTAASAWTGDVNVNSGVLHIPSNVNTGFGNVPAGLGTINLAAGAKLFLSSTRGLAYTNSITGHTIAGMGTVTTGDVANLPDGSGKIVAAGVTFQPKNGTLTVMGDLEFAMNGPTAAQVVITASSPSACGKLDVISSNTTGGLTGLSNARLTIDALQTGAANWNVFSGATLTVVTSTNDLTGQTFAVSTDSKTGNTASPAGWTNEMRGVVSYSGTNVTVWNLHNTHQVGDGNGDLKVDIADYTLYFNNYGDKGAANAWYPGDLTGDGKVDIADYTAYFNNYGDHSAGHSAVPEPATMALLALGGLAILRRRK